MTDHMKLTDILMDELPEEHPWKGNIKGLVEKLIANGVTVKKWISVKDRLPEEEDYYLCNVESFVFPGSHFITLLKFYVGEGFGDVVTHWMPLPEPPKGE